MKAQVGVIVVALLATVSAALLDGKSQVTPTQKVIQLLQGMKAKGEQEMHEEQVQYSTYNQFCGDTQSAKNAAIADANGRMEVLTADMQKYQVEADAHAKSAAEGEADIDTWDGDMKAATKVHLIEKADFEAKEKDLSESVDALGRAISTLKRQDFDRKQASAFAQVKSVRRLKLVAAAETQARALDMFLAQEDPEGLDVRAPDAHGYEFRSGKIVDMLESLEAKFTLERKEARNAESERLHAYNLLMQDLKSSTARAEQEVASNKKANAAKRQAKATASADLTDTTASRDADQTYVNDLTATCDQKGRDFNDRQKLRKEELEAIAQAVEILSSGAVSGNAEKHLPGLLQLSTRPTSLGQLRATDSSSQQQAQNRVRALQYLEARADELRSKTLTVLVSRSKAGPFDKVTRMIKDLIVRLMEEANQEATHKGWCDTELAANEQTRSEKTAEVEGLKAEIEQLQAAIAQGTEQISELTAAIADLAAAMKKDTEMRGAESEKNAATIQDAQEAQQAVAQALAVLNEFYAKASQATALMQQKKQQPEAPEIFDSPYKGMQAENGGVLGMLEVVQTDFARLEAETTASEAAAKKEHETFMSESLIDKKAKERDLSHRQSKKADDKATLGSKQTDLEETQKVLDAALTYFDKLKPSCIDSEVSYEDRVARRKEEIESLQEALRILNGDLP